MFGNFTISSACLAFSALVPMTNSCITLPVLRTTNFTVSPCRTSMRSGVKRMLSAMPTSMVRFARLGIAGDAPVLLFLDLTGPFLAVWALRCGPARVASSGIAAAAAPTARRVIAARLLA
jgi:hypothetical protein